MVTGVARREEPLQGLRRLDPARDLHEVAELLRITFQDEIGRQEMAWLHDMETLGALPPLTWVLNQVNIALGGLFSGFVWVENGRIVGNVTISRVTADNWMISNVAVHPDHRRQGIARQLMEAAIDWIRSRGARWVTLQVRHDNVPARSLYLGMGFAVVNSSTEMHCWGLDEVTQVPPPEPYRLRAWRRDDGRQVYQLACTVVPRLAQAIRPIRPRDYDLHWTDRLMGWLGRLVDLSAGRHWVVEDGSGVVVATLGIKTGQRGHVLELMVHPDVQGRLEEALVTRALAALSRYRSNVRAEVDARYSTAVEVLQAYRFREIRTLDRMALELASPRRIPIRYSGGT